MKTNVKHKQHKKAHHKHKYRPAKLASKGSVHTRPPIHKRTKYTLKKNTTAITTGLVSAVVGTGLLGLLVVRKGLDTFKKFFRF